MRRFSLLIPLFFLSLSNLGAQQSKTSPEPEQQEKIQEESIQLQTTPRSPKEKLDSLRTISEPLADSLEQIEKLRTQLENAPTESSKESIQSTIDKELERISKLRENFQDIVGGAEAAEYQEIDHESASLQDQATELIQPLLSSLREATSQPRELDALRKRLEGAREREKKSKIVLSRIERLIRDSSRPEVIAELETARRVWKTRESDAKSQAAVLGLQIDDRNSGKKPIFETLSSGISSFFASRGLNVMLAILVAISGFILTRKAYYYFRKISPVHSRDKDGFATRAADLIAVGLSFLVAILGILLVFYLRGDWLLLTIVILFILGIIWAGKAAIPPYLEQIRLILNLGAVRENERVIYEGLPWKVSKLGFYTIFTNPDLQGGLMRIPIRDVLGMISRPLGPKEVWFPCDIDDWFVLSDETFGKSITQTPDQVVVLQLGGSTKTYPTVDFLALAPENLSHGFRITAIFGIDYKHQAESTTTVPEIFQKDLTSSLLQAYGRDAVRSIKVDFSSAGASSLDYAVLADFDGSMAPRYNALKREIQKICVDTCSENGWGIPFAQITVHRAELDA
ncbi:hypothetical protein [Luteolibacter sp. AS25]|uniref:hypothetical protein n=1 Tax=Luteolibacter sp. AS25 TaxID=3135776 RepID=UPI00398B3F7F